MTKNITKLLILLLATISATGTVSAKSKWKKKSKATVRKTTTQDTLATTKEELLDYLSTKYEIKTKQRKNKKPLGLLQAKYDKLEALGEKTKKFDHFMKSKNDQDEKKLRLLMLENYNRGFTKAFFGVPDKPYTEFYNGIIGLIKGMVINIKLVDSYIETLEKNIKLLSKKENTEYTQVKTTYIETRNVFLKQLREISELAEFFIKNFKYKIIEERFIYSTNQTVIINK
ncbi:hypothetical protein HN446_00485 [bacterium]|mgnify:CR=1 FL=1|jgi:hypothetical protein|nr:hypothetical protein [bacterium]